MQRDKLTKVIEKHQAHIEDDVRDYIGASSIGGDCLRKIWYEFNGYKGCNVTPKTRRTWDIGKHLESLVYEWLMESGVDIEVMQSDHFADGMPFFKGHSDGIIKIDGIVYILEVKTAKDSSFKLFVKDGLKVWNPQYYAQVQSYMGMTGIHSAYILVLNKDNSELSDELVLFDEEFYKELEKKALMISKADNPPPRIHGSPIFYLCKMCKFNKECHR